MLSFVSTQISMKTNTVEILNLGSIVWKTRFGRDCETVMRQTTE